MAILLKISHILRKLRELLRHQNPLIDVVTVTLNDQQLIQDCLSGQTESFGELVLRYQDRLFNSLVKILGSRDEALDVAQDAFTQAYQKLSTFRGDSQFYSWLFRIGFNAAITQQRKKKRRNAVSLDNIKDNTRQEISENREDLCPSHSMQLTEQQTMVHKVLSELSDEYRIVIVLKEMEGNSYEEISQLVGCPVGTVRSRLHRARLELKERLSRVMSQN